MKYKKRSRSFARFSIVFVCLFLANPFTAFRIDATERVLPAPKEIPDLALPAAVERAVSIGLIPDYTLQDYAEPVTRAEFSEMAVKVYEAATGNVIVMHRLFSDTDDIYAQKISGIAVVDCVEDDRFLPDDTMSREEIMLYFSRLIMRMRIPVERMSLAFSDTADPSSRAPKASATKGQAVEGLLQIYDLGVAVKLAEMEEILDEEIPLGKYERTEKEITFRQYEEEIMEMVNAERRKAGLTPLVCSEILNAAAMVRAQEIENRFSHDRPDGRSFSTVFDDFRIQYRLRGENLAKYFRTSEDCVKGWVNSEMHKLNMLYEPYRKAGVGVHEDASGRLYWAMIYSD
ncbi:MAG: CAP domain-containing protein [Clostridiales bacterium]|nr:CAP domain-containing protein [Clostridiales bacterium]